MKTDRNCFFIDLSVIRSEFGIGNCVYIRKKFPKLNRIWFTAHIIPKTLRIEYCLRRSVPNTQFDVYANVPCLYAQTPFNTALIIGRHVICF